MSSRVEPLYATGKVPLGLRLVALPFALGLMWALAQLAGELIQEPPEVTLGGCASGGLAAAAVLALLAFFLGLFLWETRLGLEGETLVVAHRGLRGWRTWRFPVADIEAVQLRHGRIRTMEFWDVSLVLKDQRPFGFTRLYADREHPPVAELQRLADALGRPVVLA